VKIEKGKKQILMKIASLELLYPLTQIDFGGEKYESNRYTSEKLYNIFIILSIKHAANIAWLEAAETRSADEKRRERERGEVEGGRAIYILLLGLS
jgi:hypothetical protein